VKVLNPDFTETERNKHMKIQKLPLFLFPAIFALTLSTAQANSIISDPTGGQIHQPTNGPFRLTVVQSWTPEGGPANPDFPVTITIGNPSFQADTVSWNWAGSGFGLRQIFFIDAYGAPGQVPVDWLAVVDVRVDAHGDTFTRFTGVDGIDNILQGDVPNARLIQVDFYGFPTLPDSGNTLLLLAMSLAPLLLLTRLAKESAPSFSTITRAREEC
jgi:hypothetical protein